MGARRGWRPTLGVIVVGVVLGIACWTGFRFVQHARFSRQGHQLPPPQRLFVMMDPRDPFDRSFLLGIKLARPEPPDVQLVVLDIATPEALRDALTRLPARQATYILGPNTSQQTIELLDAITNLVRDGDQSTAAKWQFILGDATTAIEADGASRWIPGDAVVEGKTRRFSRALTDRLLFTAPDNQQQVTRLFDELGERSDALLVLVDAASSNKLYVDNLLHYIGQRGCEERTDRCTGCQIARFSSVSDVSTIVKACRYSAILPVSDRKRARELVPVLATLNVPVYAPDTFAVEPVWRRARKYGLDMHAVTMTHRNCQLRQDVESRFGGRAPGPHVLQDPDVDLGGLVRGYNLFRTWEAIAHEEPSFFELDRERREIDKTAIDPYVAKPARPRVWVDQRAKDLDVREMGGRDDCE